MPVDGLGVSDMDTISCTHAGSSVIPLGADWGSYPVGRSWGTGPNKYSCQAYLGIVMLEDSLRYHYFARVDFSCVAISECSSTRFSQFIGTLPLLMCSTVENMLSKTTWC